MKVGIIGDAGAGTKSVFEAVKTLEALTAEKENSEIVIVGTPEETPKAELPRGIILKKVEKQLKSLTKIQNFIPPKTRAERRKEERKKKK